MAKVAKQNNLKPYLLVHPNCLPDFEGIDISNKDPNCVILGDAVDEFSYKNLNKVNVNVNINIHLDKMFTSKRISEWYYLIQILGIPTASRDQWRFIFSWER